MSPEYQKVELEETLKTTPAEVYRAFTNATALRDWLCDFATVEPRPGGRLYLWWASGYYACGEFISLESDKKIVFLYHGRKQPADTEVTITLTEKDGKTLLKLAHTGIPQGEEWAKAFEDIKHGWESGLRNLKSSLETGEDLRVTKRPMLGVYIGDFNEKRAAQLGVPITHGIRVEDTVPEMGARAAGLQKDDVLVEINGKTIVDFTTIPLAIQGKEAGEEVKIAYYRGKEKKQVNIVLAGRKIPEIPLTADALAKAVGEMYATCQADLESALSGASEEEASTPPAAGEWSARECLAHLIHAERDIQVVINDMSYNQERVADGFADNLPARIKGTLLAYPTVGLMLEEFKRNQMETVAILGGLPDEFVAHRGTYWRLAFTMMTFSKHIEEHIQQIQEALKAARKA